MRDVSGEIVDGETERQDALVLEIARLAREMAGQFARPSQVDDLVQDVVVEALISIREGRWPKRGAHPALINAVLKRRWRNRITRRVRKATREALRGAEVHPTRYRWASPLVELEHAEVMAACEEALKHVPRMTATVYRMIREEGREIKWVAKRCRRTPNSVRAHLQRAERAIRTELLALGIMPDGTQASAGQLFAAEGGVAAVRERRLREGGGNEADDAAAAASKAIDPIGRPARKSRKRASQSVDPQRAAAAE